MSLSDVAPALIGIGGVAVGGAIQWVAATKAQRSQYLLGVAEKRGAYYGELLLAVDRLTLAHGRDVDRCRRAIEEQVQAAEHVPGETMKVTYSRAPEVLAAIEGATKEWREVYGNRYVNAGDPVATTMTQLDESREKLVVLFNQAKLPAALAYFDGEFDRSVRRVKMAVAFAGAQSSAIVMHETSHWWNRKLRRSGDEAVADALRRLQEIDSETVATS